MKRGEQECEGISQKRKIYAMIYKSTVRVVQAIFRALQGLESVGQGITWWSHTSKNNGHGKTGPEIYKAVRVHALGVVCAEY